MKTIAATTKAALTKLPAPSKAACQTKDFEVTYFCVHCPKEWQGHSDTPGRRASECMACQRRLANVRFRAICPPLYLETDPARLNTPKMLQVYAWKYGPRGLLINGQTGLGKTRMAWLLLEKILTVEKPKLSFAYFDCVSFGHEIARHYQREDAESWLSDLARKDLVFLDDLGKLKLTERAEAELFGLIERRCAYKKPIIATTNDTGETLAARVTDNRADALVRRLREFCEVISL